MFLEQLEDKMKLEEYLDNDRMKKYPELEKLANSMADDILKEINVKTKNLKSAMPYKSQYVLERIIEILEKEV